MKLQDIFLMVLLAALCIYVFRDTRDHRPFDGKKRITWHRACYLQMIPLLKEGLYERGISKAAGTDVDIFFPCNYGDSEREMEKMTTYPNAKYGIIDGVDLFVSKKSLAEFASKDVHLAKHIPQSWTLSNISIGDRGGIYIIKKDTQRQDNIIITSDWNKAVNALHKQGYAVIQRLLTRPFKINARKVDMRFYVVLTISADRREVYVCEDGFLYYSREPTKAYDTQSFVSTGYIDRRVYETNPLTHKDLYRYLDKNGYNPQKLRKSAHKVLHDIFSALLPEIGGSLNTKYTQHNMLFQHFGVDIAVKDDLECKLLEINKGPDLTHKDQRDRAIKKMFISNMLDMVLGRPHNLTCLNSI